MQILSLNTGQPREVTWNGKTVRTAIWKDPVEGPLRVERLGLEGDRQADLTVHGGPDKALYLYPSEHYPVWQRELAVSELPWGALGENFTVSGLLEDVVRIGDLLGTGTAEVRVTHPRMPCATLDLRHRTPGLVERLLETGLSGFYCAVAREGVVEAGDSVRVLERDPQALSVLEVFRAYSTQRPDTAVLQRAVELFALPEAWKERFRAQLRRGNNSISKEIPS